MDRAGVEASAATPPSRARVLHRAALALLFAETVVLGVALGIYLIKTSARQGGPSAIHVSLHDITRDMDLTANPCDDFYRYVCGRWEAHHPNAHNEFHLVRKMTVDLVTKWLKNTPVPDPHQSTARDKIWSLYRLCSSVYQNQVEDLDKAKELLSEMGLTIGPEVPANVSLVDLLVKFSLGYHLPLTLSLQFKYDLRSTRTNETDVILTFSQEGPAFSEWIRVSLTTSYVSMRDHSKLSLCVRRKKET